MPYANPLELHKMLTHFSRFSPSHTQIKKVLAKAKTFFMGRVVGFEPTHNGTTIRGLNHLTTPAINVLAFIILSNKYSKSSQNIKTLVSCFRGSIHLSFLLFFGYIITFVMKFFTFSKPNLYFRKPLGDKYFKRYNRIAVFFYFVAYF